MMCQRIGLSPIVIIGLGFKWILADARAEAACKNDCFHRNTFRVFNKRSLCPKCRKEKP